MDGLLLDTEDIYTICMNEVLAKFGRPPIPWSIKAKLQGRPGPDANRIFSDWANLPMPQSEYEAECAALQKKHFPTAQPLPGVRNLLASLANAQSVPSGADEPRNVHIALATSCGEPEFKLKTRHLHGLFSVFAPDRRVLGDDPRISPGRGKPLPDIYLVALEAINGGLAEGQPPIRPAECLVFEDSVQGVEAARRAGMRVIWCPHAMLRQEYKGQEMDILAGRMDTAGHDEIKYVGEHDDGWAEELDTLGDFSYEKYGLAVLGG